MRDQQGAVWIMKYVHQQDCYSVHPQIVCYARNSEDQSDYPSLSILFCVWAAHFQGTIFDVVHICREL